MYIDYFNLRLQPFNISPDPSFLYWNPAHSGAVNILRLGLIELSPITVLTGEIGTGKTTLLLKFLEEAPQDVSVALLSNFTSGSGHLYGWVLNAYGLDASGTPIELFTRLQNHLIEEYAAGRRSVVIVDEAQNVSDTDLEQLRMLTNINSGKDVLVILYLIGQPQLRDRLLQPQNRQIAQRIGATYHLGAMTMADTAKYIEHRLKVAGASDRIFSDGALEMIHEASGGLPRIVNQICNMALVSAFADELTKITDERLEAYLTEARYQGYLTHFFPEAPSKPPAAPPEDPPADDSVPSAMPVDHLRSVRGGSQSRTVADLRAIVSRPEQATERTRQTDAVAETGFHESQEPFMPDDAPKEPERIADRDVEDGSAIFLPVAKIRAEKPPVGVVCQEDAVDEPPILASQDTAIAKSSGKPVIKIGFAITTAVAIGLFTFYGGPVATVAPPSAELVTRRAVQLDTPLQPAPANLLAPDVVVPIGSADGTALLKVALDVGATDPAIAATYYARAALRGEALAATYLGQMYETGDAVPFNVALARAWYEVGAVTVRNAQLRMAHLSVPERTGPIVAPVPVLGGPLSEGGSEFVWMSGFDTGPALYAVEVAADVTASVRRLPAQSTSALMAGDLGDAKVWRVIAFDPEGSTYAVSDWRAMGDAAEPVVSSGIRDLRTDIILEASVSTTDEAIAEAVLSIPEAGQEVVRFTDPAPEQTAVLYAFEEDRSAAQELAERLDGEPTFGRVAAVATSGSGHPPGRIIVRLAAR